MWPLHVINCATLCFGPHFIYYYATHLVEDEAWKAATHGATVNIITNFVKTILLATFLTAGEVVMGIQLKDLATLGVAVMDIVGLFVATSFNPQRDMAKEQKFQAIGLGWAFGDSLVNRLIPIGMGAIAPEYTLKYILLAVQSNIVLVHSIAFACVGALLWAKRTKSPGSLPLMRGSVLLLAFVPAIISILENHKVISGFIALVVELLAALLGVAAAVLLYNSSKAKYD